MNVSALRRGLATGASVAVATAGLAAFAPTASAASAAVVFDCTTATGVKQFTTVADTDLPATVPFGQTLDVKSTATVTVPDEVRNTLYGFLGARTVEGNAVVRSTLNGAPLADITETVPVTPVPDSGPLVVDAAGPAPQFKAEKVGTNVIKVVTYTANLTFRDGDGDETLLSPMSIPCTPQAGQDLTVDSVVVTAPTTTTVVVADGKATATVSSTAGTPAGSVDFVVGGKTVKAALAGGKATVTLPELPVGTHELKASFTAPAADGWLPSSATGSHVVAAPVVQETTTAVKAKATKKSIKAKVAVLNADETPASGTVKMVLKKGKKKVGKAAVELNELGAGRAVFKKITAKGKYTLVAKYTGSELSEKSKVTVTVKKK